MSTLVVTSCAGYDLPAHASRAVAGVGDVVPAARLHDHSGGIDEANSGGLMVHKARRHFDLVN